MTEENPQPALEPRGEESPARRSRARGSAARRPATVAPRRTAASAVARPARTPGSVVRPLKSLAALSVVGGLVATFAIPAFAPALTPTADAQSLQQVAVDDAQTLLVASDATGEQLTRDSYSATTPEEIQKKKDDEAAAERARQLASVASVPFNLNMVAPGTGAVRWPVGGPFTVSDRVGDRGGAHMGTDMLAAGGTPVFAALDGVVSVSQENYYGFGVAVVLESVLNGQRIRTVYPHMQYGSRQVEVGQTVSAGQLVGLVGTTGSSTANHLHFEVWIDGQVVDSLAWLQANAG